MVERSTVVVDTVLSIHRNRLVTSSILVVRTFCFSRDRLACKPSTLRREQRRVAAANVDTPATHTCSYHTGAYPRNNRENCTLHIAHCTRTTMALHTMTTTCSTGVCQAQSRSISTMPTLAACHGHMNLLTWLSSCEGTARTATPWTMGRSSTSAAIDTADGENVGNLDISSPLFPVRYTIHRSTESQIVST